MTKSRRSIRPIRVARYAILLGALAVALVLILGPTWVKPVHAPSGLRYDQLADHSEYAAEYIAERAPQYSLAVFIICLALWLTNLIPLASTGLLAIALLPLLGIFSPKEAFAYFGNGAVFFILGVFILSAAMIRTGLSKRLTLVMLQRFDRRPGMLVVGVTCSASFLSLWMPAYAVAAMMFPIIFEIADSLGLEKGKSGYAKSLFFGLAWGAVIGGCGTFLGGARAVLAVELLQDTYRSASGAPMFEVTFVEWIKVAIPLVVVMTALAVFTLRRFVHWELDDITAATRMLNMRVAALGPMTGRERRLTAVVLVTVFCWVVLGHRLDMAVIAVSAAVAMAVFRIVNWQEIQDYVNWGVVIMYGGAVAIGTAIKDTHAMMWVVEQVVPAGGAPPLLLLVLMGSLSLGLSCCISNTAAVAVLLPVGFALCDIADPAVHPVAMTFAVASAAGLAFVLPISSPPLAICFASNYYDMKEVPKYGIPLTALALAVLIVVMAVYWPMVGVSFTVR